METRFAERVKIIRLASQGSGTSEIAGQVGRTRLRVLAWIKRFNEHEMAGLGDLARSGRPIYRVEDRSTVIAIVLTSPEILGLPFASWTLDRRRSTVNWIDFLVRVDLEQLATCSRHVQNMTDLVDHLQWCQYEKHGS